MPRLSKTSACSLRTCYYYYYYRLFTFFTSKILHPWILNTPPPYFLPALTSAPLSYKRMHSIAPTLKYHHMLIRDFLLQIIVRSNRLFLQGLCILFELMMTDNQAIPWEALRPKLYHLNISFFLKSTLVETDYDTLMSGNSVSTLNTEWQWLTFLYNTLYTCNTTYFYK